MSARSVYRHWRPLRMVEYGMTPEGRVEPGRTTHQWRWSQHRVLLVSVERARRYRRFQA